MKRMRGMGIGAAMVVAVIFCGAWSISPASAQQIRCWTNPSGSRECSDLPPPADAKSVSDVRGRAGRIDGQESFAQRQATDRFPVTLWSNECGEPCSNARKLLTGRGVPFSDRNPALPEMQEEFKRLTKGQMNVPLLIVGTAQLTGFEEGQWNSTLDAAGYSRSPSSA
ncbi:MAG: glutaredoxin family protein, partial [Proteobacteria bacterium]|nr:glutaredoxin family protein [Burkholderiales bacterium]